jgi:hypothetical protein
VNLKDEIEENDIQRRKDLMKDNFVAEVGEVVYEII